VCAPLRSDRTTSVAVSRSSADRIWRSTGVAGRPSGNKYLMATYSVNKAAVAHARRLIDAKQYVLNSDWGRVQPRAAEQNKFLKSNSWEDYALWHLGLTEGATDETKARYGFVFGDLKRVHRTGLIACVYRASEWRHKDIELAAHNLLQYLDKKSGYATPTRRAA
jgi:hypothetical protein